MFVIVVLFLRKKIEIEFFRGANNQWRRDTHDLFILVSFSGPCRASCAVGHSICTLHNEETDDQQTKSPLLSLLSTVPYVNIACWWCKAHKINLRIDNNSWLTCRVVQLVVFQFCSQCSPLGYVPPLAFEFDRAQRTREGYEYSGLPIHVLSLPGILLP
jgi:hypothetical protein